MNGKELLETRRSVRKFKDELVSREVMNQVIDLTRWAPSWKNCQVARFNIVENKEIIDSIAEMGVNDFIYNTKTLKNAKSICVLSYKKGISGTHEGKLATSKTDWEVFDAGIAAHQFCLACYEYGIGTVIMGIIDEQKISEIIDLPEDEAVGAIIVYGYHAGDYPNARPRKDVNELVRYL